ncbi:MAG TPA: folate family ECF transporter S component [Bacillota bacterium]|nr:folate family ECF transporter S component [Bacillota bacterium]HNT03981.1 folate family ECF transporter S component [Bacillota bacterium]HPA54845.1 folate family ECF transporter S component [Bacillota bacterium]HPX69512.1 folate family ECF transporter S component [Bacillota bacterium]HQA66349.1 folate family ECF transporter S component [Bacillota bacterium]
MSKAKTIAFVGLLVSMEIIFTRFLSIQTPIIRIGFGFIPIAFTAILFGPLIGGTAAAIADITGMMIFPKFPFFPGFTLSAFLTGAIYGLFLYRKPITIVNIGKSVLLITILVDLGLTSLWVYMTTGNAASVFLMPRILKSAIMLPIQIVTINVLWKYIGSHIDKARYAKEH